MPWTTNEDGAEVDTGTGAVTTKPNHMSPADQATQPDAEGVVSEEKAVDVVEAENKSVRGRRKA